MEAYTKLPKKKLYLILGPLGILIFLLSLEVLMRAKDINLFDTWLTKAKTSYPELSNEEMFRIYISGNMSLYFQKIVIPIGLSIHSYLAYLKLRISKLFVFIWTILSLGGLAYTVIDLSMSNVLMYGYILIYLVVIGTILSLLGIISDNKKQ